MAVIIEDRLLDNVVQLPSPADPLVGPFKYWKVQVDGRVIPRLTGHYEGDKIVLVVDGRFAHSFRKEDAYQAAWLIAQALAIGEGYTHSGAEAKDHPFAPLGCEIKSQ